MICDEEYSFKNSTSPDKKVKDAQSSAQEPEESTGSRIRSILHLPSELQDWSSTSWCGGVTYIVIGALAIVSTTWNAVSEAYLVLYPLWFSSVFNFVAFLVM